MADEAESTALSTEVHSGHESGNMLAMVLQAANDPTVDAVKMNTLADLAIKLQDRERETEFRKAKVAMLMECAELRITKRGAITNKAGQVQSRYSKFEDIHRVVVPIMARHNLAVSFDIGHTTAGGLTVRYVLSHVNGYEERGDAMPLAIDTTGSKNATQGAGSAASYGKRHVLKALCNLIEEAEDDDGQLGKGGGGYDALPQEHKDLIDEGRAESLRGSESYAAWFKALDQGKRGFLAFNYNTEANETWHDQNKAAAALVTGGTND